jgi:hypothetical protein
MRLTAEMQLHASHSLFCVIPPNLPRPPTSVSGTLSSRQHSSRRPRRCCHCLPSTCRRTTIR